MLHRLWLPLLLAVAVFAPTRALAIDEADLLPVEQAFALSAQAHERGRIAFTWAIADGYYLYRHRIKIAPVDGDFKFNPLELPPGQAYTDEFFGEVETYRGSVTALLTGAAADGVRSLSFRVGYQGCADVGVCYPPHTQEIAVVLPAGPAGAGTVPVFQQPAAGPAKPLLPGLATPEVAVEGLPLPEAQAFGFEAIASSPTELLLRYTPAPGYYLYRDRGEVAVEGQAVTALEPQWPPATDHFDDHFGAVAVYFDAVEVPVPLDRRRPEAQQLTVVATFQGCQTDGICYPPMTRRVALSLPAIAEGTFAPPPRTAPAFDLSTLLVALLGAVLGGLILNLMPCVLPVLSLKALSLAESGRSGGHARSSALWYTLGVLLTFAAVGFAVLALRAAGQALGWGFQLQQPGIVAALALVMFAIGLNLSGVFEIGAGLAGRGQGLAERPGRAGDFFTGVLAVVVASPCTAPFMATALAFAFAAPAAVALTVFLALGLGLALPFLLIGFVPAFARLLPRPGAWMLTFKQAMAFPMYLAAIWLLWVLGRQRGVDAVALLLVAMTLIGAGLWLWGRQGLQRGRMASALALLLLALGVSGAVTVGRLAAPPAQAAAEQGDSVAYSAERLAALRAQGRVVFVNMTADWCVTCKANERRILGGDTFRDALAAIDAVYMKGDWTNVDPAITAFLDQHGAVGVPLYVVFPKSGGAGQVLPTVLTQAMVDEALAAAVR